MNTAKHDTLPLAEEAAEWVMRRMEDRSPECSAELLQWLKISPRHIDEFLLAAATYAALRGSEAGKKLDIDTLIRDVSTNVVPFDAAPSLTLPRFAGEGKEPASSSGRGRIKWPRLAAAIALFSVALSLLWPHLKPGGTYTTAIGEQRAVRLADGSVLNLNTQSRVEVRFNKHVRELRLVQGEALFTVAHDPARPFRVLTRSAVVQAVGTRFNVYEHNGRTEVSVVEGRVRVEPMGAASRPSQSPALLGAGEQIEVKGAGRIYRRTLPDVVTAVAWQQRRLTFRAVPLAEVAEQFNRYNEYQIRIEDPALGRRLIWGVFGVDEPQALVKFLERDPSLELENSRSQLIVRPRPAEPAH